MAIRQKILIVDEDKNLCDCLAMLLSEHGSEMLVANTMEDALSLIASHCPELILLDPDLPDGNGREILDSVREWSLMPVIILTKNRDEAAMVELLDAGADDYIIKPCSTEVLLARIRVAIRHTRGYCEDLQLAREGKYVVGGLTIDYNKYRVYVDGVDINLTQNEFRMVALLGQYAGRVLTYKWLKNQLWGPNSGRDTMILRVNMRNIRKKLEKVPGGKRYILTETGIGFRLISKEELEASEEKQ